MAVALLETQLIEGVRFDSGSLGQDWMPDKLRAGQIAPQ
jgi:hypothetical protein